MKSLQNKATTATLALVCAGILGGLAPIAAKILLRELPPMTITFLRYAVASVILVPLVYRQAPALIAHWKKLVLLSAFFAGNIFLFILGVGYTTSAVSQLLYGAVPVLMFIEQTIGTKKSFQPRQLLGILFGLSGTLIIVLHPASGAVGLGTVYGNTLLTLATICWSLYLLAAKRISTIVTPIEITAATAFMTLVASIGAMIIFEGNQMAAIASLSAVGWAALLFVGIVLSIVMWYLYNFGIKYGSTLLTSSIVYLNTATAGVAGFFVFGETIASSFLLGAALLVSGVYLISRYK